MAINVHCRQKDCRNNHEGLGCLICSHDTGPMWLATDSLTTWNENTVPSQ